MKTKIIIASLLVLLGISSLKAQFVVTDPVKLSQGIVTPTIDIVQTSLTESNMINTFKEVQKMYNQGKEYYDKLKSVHNLVKDARRVKESVLMLSEISDMYVNAFGQMLQDDNFTYEELEAIAFGYTKLIEEGTNVLLEIKDIVSVTSLSMTDKERMDMIDRFYNEIKNYRNLTRYYTNKNISVSYLRAKEKGDTNRILSLYGTAEERYW